MNNRKAVNHGYSLNLDRKAHNNTFWRGPDSSSQIIVLPGRLIWFGQVFLLPAIFSKKFRLSFAPGAHLARRTSRIRACFFSFGGHPE